MKVLPNRAPSWTRFWHLRIAVQCNGNDHIRKPEHIHNEVFVCHGPTIRSQAADDEHKAERNPPFPQRRKQGTQCRREGFVVAGV